MGAKFNLYCFVFLGNHQRCKISVTRRWSRETKLGLLRNLDGWVCSCLGRNRAEKEEVELEEDEEEIEEEHEREEETGGRFLFCFLSTCIYLLRT